MALASNQAQMTGRPANAGPSAPESGSSGPEEEEKGAAQRGRQMKREGSAGAKEDGADSADDGGKNGAGTGPRKRKRSRKGLDKKYLCPHEDCGKSYSRAEHLYRHQLNHTPKQIYKCDFPDCPRWFVRQDLCARHRERHTTRGSHLQRKDSVVAPSEPNEPSAAVESRTQQRSSARSPPRRTELSISTTPYSNSGFDLHSAPTSATDVSMQMHRGPMSASFAEPFHSQQSRLNDSGIDAYTPTQQLHRSNGDSHFYNDTSFMSAPSRSDFGSSLSSTGFDASSHAAATHLDSLRFHQSHKLNGQYPIPSPSDTDSPTTFKRPQSQLSFQPSNQWLSNDYGNTSHQNFGLMGTVTPQSYSTPAQPMGSTPVLTPSYAERSGFMNNIQPYEDMSVAMNDPSLGDISMGGFDDDYGQARSPTVLAENFAVWLFNGYNNMAGVRHHDSQLLDPSLSLPLPNGNLSDEPLPDRMAVTSILGSSAPGSVISESKRQSLLELIQSRFNETEHSAVGNQKDRIFSGDVNHESHVLSLRSLQTYIGSYWYHFHDQMPILHQPTFSADNAQNLLLIVVIAIGAANLDKMHGQEKTSAGAELANFLAWHLRGEVFMDKDFPPPTKLWVLQTLLLLEAYEKLYSSRVMHERSQIHHATTISLLRRGSALLGRSALDSPPNEEDGGTSSSIIDSPDPWWNHWVTTEATKRVALAAFIMDSTHATMFSHTMVMVAHEMRLRLPCDETLWTATSGVEVSRLRDEYGGDPIAFLDGLKSTLNGRPIRTNSFGRAALMAGLLNVSFHLGQRDMQVRSLGVELGGKDRWRGTLTKAFDMWERDWDNNNQGHRRLASEIRNAGKAHEPSTFSLLRWQGPSGRKEEEQLFESRVVLHHLAHMGMHVDIVQCQIFAGAKRLLGRTVTEPDRKNAERRMRELWAPKASARDAVFYSLRFLSQVLQPYLHPPASPDSTATSSTSSGIHFAYSPRDDYLLNRPWVLYFAALVVWSYGFALEGPLAPGSVSERLLTEHTAQVEDMRSFMVSVGTVVKPDDLAGVRGRNRCVGLLCVLIASFRKCRWELLREAAKRLRDCVNKLTGRDDHDDPIAGVAPAPPAAGVARAGA